MDSHPLQITDPVKLVEGRMVLAFTGWMDGGDVSTGTVSRLVENLRAQPCAQIQPDDFYLYNFPGGMELASLFRPHIRIEAGSIKSYHPPTNTFFADRANDIIFFLGKEPHLNWQRFGECIFSLAEQSGISRIYFVGSFGGAVPHTREPRLYATVSNPALLEPMMRLGVRPSRYEGPASFASHLLTHAAHRGIEMATLAVEIPGYLEGANPMSIEAVTRRLALILNLNLDLSPLRVASTEWELRVTEEVAKNEELAEQVRQLEEQYDDDLIGIQRDESDESDSEDQDQQ